MYSVLPNQSTLRGINSSLPKQRILTYVAQASSRGAKRTYLDLRRAIILPRGYFSLPKERNLDFIQLYALCSSSTDLIWQMKTTCLDNENYDVHLSSNMHYMQFDNFVNRTIKVIFINFFVSQYNYMLSVVVYVVKLN